MLQRSSTSLVKDKQLSKLSDFEILEQIGKISLFYFFPIGEGTSGKVYKACRGDFIYALKKTKINEAE